MRCLQAIFLLLCIHSVSVAQSPPDQWKITPPPTSAPTLSEKVATPVQNQSPSQPPLPARPFINRPIAEVLASAKTICIYQPGEGNPTVKAKVSERLTRWGHLTLLSTPEGADLVLDVLQIGKYRMKDHLESYSSATATLREPGSSVELWTVTKGSYWAISGFSIATVSNQIGDAFVKFFESTLKQANKNKK